MIVLKRIMVLIFSVLFLTSCNNEVENRSLRQFINENISKEVEENQQAQMVNISGTTIEDRFSPPEGFTRIPVPEVSYGQYLRNLPLKPHGSKVLYYDGATKDKSNVYEAVVDMDIGHRDLQQCADAIMRLRAEYLYQLGRYDEIHFNFTNGFRVDYSKWMEGYRVKVEGNNTEWVKSTDFSGSYESFRKYLDIIFAYAGSLSLSKELKAIEVGEMEIGDVFIQGGSPGHAVIVVDMAENMETGEKIFILAQSYMPAQEIQILQNPLDKELSPWYNLNFGERLITPEWEFTNKDLKRFQ